MADPIIPNVWRAQVVLQGVSDLPEDRYVTTWAFRGGTADQVAGALREFWGTPTTTGGPITLLWIGGAVSPTRINTINVYALADPPPREPQAFTLAAKGGTAPTALPSEVAVCLSFYSERNLPRRRGRVYIGPLGTTALRPGAGAARPAQDLRDHLVLAAQRLGNRGDVEWGVVSKAAAAFYPITNGWVDDAFDTQRRRGEAPTSRIIYQLAPPV